jgi:hypothetical protein
MNVENLCLFNALAIDKPTSITRSKHLFSTQRFVGTRPQLLPLFWPSVNVH